MGPRAHLRVRRAHFGKARVVCVCGECVCVCGVCHGVSENVLIVVFLRCVSDRHDAVCHLCATRKNRLGDLLDAHALSCHLFDGEKFLCRADQFTRKMVVNTWALRIVW